MSNIIQVSKNRAVEIISSYSPIGKFFTVDHGLYVGIDNQTGEAYVEEFETLDACFKWLCSELVENAVDFLTKEPKNFANYIESKSYFNFGNITNCLERIPQHSPAAEWGKFNQILLPNEEVTKEIA